jgi:hypothetical protein
MENDYLAEAGALFASTITPEPGVDVGQAANLGIAYAIMSIAEDVRRLADSAQPPEPVV